MAGRKIENSVLNRAREMKIGEELSYPKEKTTYIKSIAYGFGPIWDKKFAVEVDFKAGLVKLRRVA